jgi:glycolate dehydrogenase FAD-binding subunit
MSENGGRGVVLAAVRERLPGGMIEAGEGVWRYGAAGIVPEGVVRPSNVEEVAAAVRAVAECGGALVACGNATHLDVGWPPRAYDVALSTTRLARVLAHEAADMTITVEAGATLAAVDAVLAGAGQWLPLDPPRAGDMTVGGLIAADRCGPSRLSQGKVRDLLIGLGVILADGTKVRGGGRVVKNVAGYDLPKLFTGSFGTLGVIVEATFKVRPRPGPTALFVLPASSVAEAVQRALRLLDGGLCPLLLEAVNEPAAETLSLGETAALLVGLAGSAAEIGAETERMAKLGAAGATRYEGERARALVEAVRGSVLPSDEEALIAKLAALPARLAPVLERTEVEARARGVLVEITAHAGNGIAWCQVLGSSDPQAAALFAEWLRIFARQLGAWVVFEALPAALRDTFDPWGFNEKSVPLMAGVKRALDPGGVFSPGRFVGRI